MAALGLRCCARAFSSCSEGGYSLSWCAGFSLWQPLLLRSTGSRCAGFSSCGSKALERRLQNAGSAAMAHRPSCSVACGILPDQGSNLCFLHWQVDSQPLRHQGREAPLGYIFKGENKDMRYFPGGPVAETPCSQCRGPRFDPWSGNYRDAVGLTCRN